jgi:hypothetical protein
MVMYQFDAFHDVAAISSVAIVITIIIIVVLVIIIIMFYRLGPQIFHFFLLFLQPVNLVM